MNDIISGILPVYKEKNWTSFDVVGKLRGVLKIKRLGHTGTLDPMATGVLPVLIGKATKACDIIPDNKKSYKAGFRLGVETDTEDITGKVLKTSEKAVTLKDIENILPGFVGDIMQIPPMYSAVKVGGKKLYEYAREGKVIEREPRRIYVDGLGITQYDEQSRTGELVINCRKGTYVRTIISDIGRELGAYGTMTSLERTYSGGVEVNACLTVSQIEEIVKAGRLDDIIIPLEKAFEDYAEIKLDERVTALYKNGVKLRPQQVGTDADENTYRVCGFDNEFLGLGYFDNGQFRSRKNFY